MARPSERSELRFLISQRVPSAPRRRAGPTRWRRPASSPPPSSRRTRRWRRGSPAARTRTRGPRPAERMSGRSRSRAAARRPGCSRRSSARRPRCGRSSPTWVDLPVSSSRWARSMPTRLPVGSSSEPVDVDRLVVLGDLEVLRHVRIEVVLPGEHRRLDGAVEREAETDGQLDRLLVQHRQRARAARATPGRCWCSARCRSGSAPPRTSSSSWPARRAPRGR